MYSKAKELKEVTQQINKLTKDIAAVETRNLNDQAYLNALIQIQLIAGMKVQENLEVE